MLTKVEDGLGMTCVRGKLVWADPLPPFPPILTIPTIIYHTYPPCPTHHYLPTLHSILTLSTILMCRNHYQTRYTSTRLFTIFNRQNSAITHSSQLVWCVFLWRHFFSTFYIAHTISNETCPFSWGQDMSSVICKGQYTPILDHTTSHPKVFPCVVCLVMHEGSLWRQHKFSTQLILAPHPRRSLYMNIHIKTI